MQKKIGKALVVGAGIGGIRSALDLAETGHQVTLIDRAPHIGGVLAQLDVQFPTNHCGMCKMLPLVERDAGSQFCLRKGLFHENIEILTSTELSGLSGEPGDFTVRLRQSPRWIDPGLCVGCGLCETVCPVSVPDAFNGGLSTRKAVYLPVPHAIPNPYVIDLSACNRCGACETVCPTQAIRLAQDQRKAFRILVVDDELVVRDSLKEWLVNEGFASVDMAESGKQALQMLNQASYQLMLADIKMPGMDGVELLKLAKESFPELTVVMMTAYATVETAVDAMKTGALDYFMKPFDPQAMMPIVMRIYEASEASQDLERTVHAIIIATGTDYFDPSSGIDPFGYGQSPHVLTSLQFERILSGSGPGGGRLVRPADGKPVGKIAWMQCVGSRDLQAEADFCSTVCCMIAIKEAMLTREKSGGMTDTAIYYMDMRTSGKSFQRYRDKADEAGVRFERARVHSISPDPKSGDLTIRAVRLDGTIQEETVDLVILAVGQRPARGTSALAQTVGLAQNPWGFLQSQPFSSARSTRPGVYLSGSTDGLKDISASLIQSSAAALEAGRTIHAAGGSLLPAEEPAPAPGPLLGDPPRTLVVVCSCGGRLETVASREDIASRMRRDPSVSDIVFMQRLCTLSGWEKMKPLVEEHQPNRLLIGACHPYLFIAKLKQLARETNLPAKMMNAVDLHLCRLPLADDAPETSPRAPVDARWMSSELCMALSRLKHVQPEFLPGTPVTRRALVVGGGVAGMQAALGIADMGFQVDLVEKNDRLGGNLRWLHQTLDGHAVAPLTNDTIAAVEKHPLIRLHLSTRVAGACGRVGHFHTTLQALDHTGSTGGDSPAAPGERITHGVTVLATGGHEAATDRYGYGTDTRIVTQKELEQNIASGGTDARALASVVMIQCVGSREEPRNYCSRVCCPTALKHALQLKKINPDIAVYILYRDMMAMGFAETYYTEARKAGVIFIQYDPAEKPKVSTRDGLLTVTARDPVLDAPVAIEADLVVLAVGLNPAPAPELLKAFGAAQDPDGFFLEAEPKWRPVDSMKEGVFACGLTLAPQTLDEAVAGGQAAAQRALRILTRTRLPAGTPTAVVRVSLCSLCLRCIDTCPYTARWVDEQEGRIHIDPGMCQGCGACAAICPNGAAVLQGCAKPQVLDMIDAAFN